LLEGMVFGPRAVEAIAAGLDGPDATGVMRPLLGSETRIGAVPLALGIELPSGPADPSADPVDLRHQVQHVMSLCAGVQRSSESLAECAGVLDATLLAAGAPGSSDVAMAEIANLAIVGRVLVEAAIARIESRGTHSRVDYPETNDDMAYRLVVGGPSLRGTLTS
jgi:L-aspartate oxidase